MPCLTPRCYAQLTVLLLFLTTGRGTIWAAVGTLADSSGEVVAWGENTAGQTTVPSGS
jgi:hypothetical protein